MIRISVFVWMVVLALLGVGLFQVKYNVQAQEKELRKVRKQIEANYNAIHVLEAEWSYLNDPLRLADLARRHTDLVPTTPDQIKDIAEIAPRLPGPPMPPEMLQGLQVANAPKPSAAPAKEKPKAIVPVSVAPSAAQPAAPSVPQPVAKPTDEQAAADEVIDAILADMQRASVPAEPPSNGGGEPE